jgi:hypothetical protein
MVYRNNQLIEEENKFSISDSDFLFLRGNASPYPLQFSCLKVQVFDKIIFIHLSSAYSVLR